MGVTRFFLNLLENIGSDYLDTAGQNISVCPTLTINDLPTEVLTRILEYFENDLSSLKTFSLVSRPFLSICRKRLFSTLRLNSLGFSFNHKCDEWMSLLNRSTDFITSLQILELGPAVFRFHTRDKVYSDHWIQVIDQKVPSIHDSRVQTIIRHALNPQTVILRFEFQAWKDFSLTFQEVVTELIQRKTVSSLSLEDVVDFPMVALSGCRYLRELSLISFNICESAEDSGLSLDEVLEGSKSYLESLTLFASDQCVKNLISVLSSSRSTLDLTRLRRLSINSTGSDGLFAMKKIPLIARGITTLELRVGGQSGTFSFTISLSLFFFSIQKNVKRYMPTKKWVFFSEVDYDVCNLCNFPNLRSLLISLSYNCRKRPIRDLATFLSKSDSSTPSTLEELRILFRHEVQALQLEILPQDTLYLFQHKDWRIVEHELGLLNLFPALRKLCLGLRPKDVGAFMNESLRLRCISSLGQLMPTLYAMMGPTIEVFDGMSFFYLIYSE